jgi:DNA polymerase-3 subunit epsilon
MLKVLKANDAELELHNERLDLIEKKAGKVLWRDLN